ncbi:MAG: IS66 family transposase [Bacteroidales bacterium]|jgi:uncharacterized coiled-coil protein SlyX|nr:IS66 family transposase [Bacteroidales bacterium]MDR3870639.1 IS66 family transposase [Phocaeicola sp.]MEE1163192.1 IS66 family transposase [Lachnospiraceae bacterium]
MTLEERIKQLEERNAELEKRLADKDSRIADLDRAIASKDSRIADLDRTVTSRDNRIADLDRKIVSKDNRIAYLEQQLYGSRSEKRLPINPDALQLSLFATEIDPQEQQRLDASIAKDEEKREKLLKVDGYERKVRKPIDTSRLEVREEHIYPEGINLEEYNEMEPLVTESLVLVPQKMYIRRIVRHKYVLKASLQQPESERRIFEVADLPAAPLHKCMASESVLADILVQKFVYHLPFYRVIQKYREMGVSVSDSTLGGWYAAVCEKLKPIYDRLKVDILSAPYIQVDESTVPVIDNEKSKTRKGYMWCVRDASGSGVFFHYDMGSRGTQVAMSLLKDYQGAIQSDGYDVYSKFTGMEGKTMLGCWAHARRKFVDAMKENERLASEALVYIGDLYHIETLTAEMTNEERKKKRREMAYPQIIKFEEWMQMKYFDPSMGPLMRTAIEYTFKRLPKLSMYVNDGSWHIDNNGVENAIRPLAVGRKSYLFCGSDASAVRASMIYSFIATCKAAGIEPREWFEDVIRRIPEYENGKADVTHLLPKNWKASSKL